MKHTKHQAQDCEIQVVQWALEITLEQIHSQNHRMYGAAVAQQMATEAMTPREAL